MDDERVAFLVVRSPFASTRFVFVEVFGAIKLCARDGRNGAEGEGERSEKKRGGARSVANKKDRQLSRCGHRFAKGNPLPLMRSTAAYSAGRVVRGKPARKVAKGEGYNLGHFQFFYVEVREIAISSFAPFFIYLLMNKFYTAQNRSVLAPFTN